VESKPQPVQPNQSSLTAQKGSRLFLKKFIFTAGLVGIVLGFFLMPYVDAYGRNWQGIVAPFLIILGYVSIVIALLLKADE